MPVRIAKHIDQDVSNELRLIRTTGIPPGVDLGFDSFREHWNWKKGQTLYLYGAPGAGKSTLSNFIDVVVSHLHGWKHVMFSPEMGSTAELITSLAQVILGQRNVSQNSEFGVDPERWDRCLTWIYQHFRFIEGAETQEDIYEAIDKLEREEGFKADSVTIDPFNQMRHRLEGKPKDEYLQNWLHTFNAEAKSKNRFQKVLVHPINMNNYKKEVELSNGMKRDHFSVVQKDQIMWGQEWDRQAYQMVSIWRPLQYTENGTLVIQKDRNGEPYMEGHVDVHVQKVKQASTGKVSAHTLKYEWTKCRYYETDGRHLVCPLDNMGI